MQNSKVKLFLTFNGNAHEAMQFYANNLPNTKIIKIERYGKTTHLHVRVRKTKFYLACCHLWGRKSVFGYGLRTFGS